MRFDQIDLRLFVAIAESHSITQGAARCALALASASARLKAMETSLGAALFHRHARGVVMTEAGEVLLDHARTVLRNIANMQSELAPYAQGANVRIRMLANTASISEHLPSPLSAYLAAQRNVCVDVEERESFAIGEAIASGKADIGLAIADVLPDGLQRWPFCDDVLMLVVPKDDAIANRAQMSFADIIAHDFVGLSAGSALQDHLVRQAARLGRRMNVRMRLRSFDAVCQMVSAGVGIAVVPRKAAQRLRRAMPIALVPLRDHWAHRTLAICARDFEGLPLAARRLVQHLTAHAVA